MTTALPNGVFKTGKLIVGNAYVTRAIRNYSNALQLGNVHASNTLLAVTSNTNGIHLSEATGTTVWIDSPLTTTQLLSANAGIVANSIVTNSASIAGGLTAQFLVSQTSVTTNTLSAVSSTVSGTQWVGGAATFQSTVNVVGATTLAGTLAAQATNLQSLTVNGASTLNTATASSLNVTVANVTSLTATTANATNINVGAANLSYDTTTAGFENLRINIGSTPAFRLYNSDQRASFAGAVVTNTVKSQAGQQLVLQSSDSSNTVIIAGNLIVQGEQTQVAVSNLYVDDKIIVVARSNTAGPDADVIASGAGIAVETGTSGYQRSLLWNYNQGPTYTTSTAGQKSTDGLPYWEMIGGALTLSRVIPSAAHIGYNFSNSTYASDSQQVKVSYQFSISDAEELLISKVAGTNLSAGGAAIGAVTPTVAAFDVPAP